MGTAKDLIINQRDKTSEVADKHHVWDLVEQLGMLVKPTSHSQMFATFAMKCPRQCLHNRKDNCLHPSRLCLLLGLT